MKRAAETTTHLYFAATIFVGATLLFACQQRAIADLPDVETERIACRRIRCVLGQNRRRLDFGVILRGLGVVFLDQLQHDVVRRFRERLCLHG